MVERHPGLEELAEFQAGLATGGDGARIAAHVAGCERCTAAGDQLAGVSALLAAAPAPTLPGPVAQRLDAALAAEVAAREAVGHASEDADRRQAPPDRSASRSWRRFRLPSPRVLAPAAAVVAVLAAAGGYGLSQISAGPAGSAATAASRAPSAQAGSARRSVAGPIYNGGAKVTPVSVVTSTADYSAATLGPALTAELAKPAAARGAQNQTGAAAACARAVSSGARPALVESARYAGQPVTIVVLSGSPRDTVLVAGPDCSATRSDIIHRTTLPAGIS